MGCVYHIIIEVIIMPVTVIIEGEAELTKFIQNLDIDAVSAFLSKHPGAKTSHPSGYRSSPLLNSGLLVACAQKPSSEKQTEVLCEIITSLLGLGAEIESKGEGAHTPLFIAVKSKNLEVVNLLIKNKANIKGFTEKELSCCIEEKSVSGGGGGSGGGVSGGGGSGGGYNKSNGTALIRACKDCNYKVVEMLLNNGADPNYADEDGRPLDIACDYADVAMEIIDLLIRAGAKLVPTFFSFYISKKKKTMTLLMEKGVDINERNDEGFTCLHLACKDHNDIMLEFLLAKGADPHLLVNGKTTLDLAYESNINKLYKTVKILLESTEYTIPTTLLKNFENLLRDAYNQHEYHVRPDYAFMKMLLEAGVNPNISKRSPMDLRPIKSQPNPTDATLLHWACLNQHHEERALLLEYDANPNIVNNKGETPLHWACKVGKISTIKCLLRYEANLNIVDSRGKTPIDYAPEDSKADILKLLAPKIESPWGEVLSPDDPDCFRVPDWATVIPTEEVMLEALGIIDDDTPAARTIDKLYS